MEMSEEARKAYRAYHRIRYANNPNSQKKASSKYWYNKACKILGKESVSENDVKKVKCDYYKQYRDTHKEQIANQRVKYWENTAKEGE